MSSDIWEAITDRKFEGFLVPKAWLKAHYQDVIPEPTIEIKVDGKNLSVNGNYKAGIIKEFMGHFCYPGEGKIRLVSVKNAIAAERRLRREFIKERKMTACKCGKEKTGDGLGQGYFDKEGFHYQCAKCFKKANPKYFAAIKKMNREE